MMPIYKPSLLDKFKDFVNGVKANWDEYEDHVAEFDAHLADYETHKAESVAHGLKQSSALQTPTLQNSWISFGSGNASPRYWKDQLNCVNLRGVVKNGVLQEPIFVLPEGYRPSALERFAVDCGGTIGQLFIFADGRVVLNVGSVNAVSLSGVRFLLD